VTADRLRRVEHAEVAVRAALADAGVRTADLRVRDLGETARVEVDAELVGVVAGLAQVVDAVRGAGFATVEVDPRGFRSGSMNDALRERAARTPSPALGGSLPRLRWAVHRAPSARAPHPDD
jgi:pyridinium-3,5-biscarboxylic acid mononucleotide sulfurtransferase